MMPRKTGTAGLEMSSAVTVPVEYEEYYRLTPDDFSRYAADPRLAHGMVDRAKRRELDHLLVLPPGTDRGTAP